MAHTSFPADLPVPIDDGACNHLPNHALPAISLPSTSSQSISLPTLPGLTILFCYPRTGAPDETVPDGWNAIPGARGCTPQACSFRDNFSMLRTLGVAQVFGLSTQSTEYQQEVHERLKLPYELLSDEELKFTEGMGLPTFEWKGKRLTKRITMAVEGGKVVKVWYPVFPPDRGVEDVVAWLKERGSS